MSISSIIHSAYSGLAASQTALRSVSGNIANVNTPGYGREEVTLESLAYGGMTGGVKIGQIRRVTDQFLENAVYSAGGDAGRFSKLQEFHDRLQGLIGSPDSKSGIGARMNNIFTAVATVAADPADAVRRQGVIDSIQRFTDEVGRLSDDIQKLRADASNQAMETVKTINSLLARIHELNPRIVREKVVSGNIGALQEQRAQALEQLSQLIDVRPVEMEDGSIHVATASGLVLVDKTVRELDYVSPGSAAPETNFPQIRVLSVNSGTGEKTDTKTALDGEIRSGRLKGLLELRDQDLPAIAASLGEMARSFMDQVNAVHNSNAAVPPPNRLSGSQTGLIGTDPHGFKGISTFAVTDQAGKVVAKTTVDFNALPPGTTLDDVITQINTGLGGAGTVSLAGGRMAIQATDPSHGVVIADDPANPSSRGGRGFSHYFGLNDLVVANQPSNFATGVKGSDPHGFLPGGTMHMELRDTSNRIIGSYTLSISGSTFDDMLTDLNAPGGLGNYMTFSLSAEGQLIATPKPGYSGAQIHVVSDTTNRGGTGTTVGAFFGVGHGVKAKSTIGMNVRKDIQNNPYMLSLAKFELSAAVGSVALGRGDQRGAAALRDLSTASLKFEQAGGVAAVTASLSQYMGFVLGDAAMKAQRAEASAEDSDALLSNVTKRRNDFSGVNLDEEMSNMLVFQNSYNASARLMTTARDMYDTLLSLVQ